MTTPKPTPRKPGRPTGSGQNLTSAIPRTRVQPETRRKFNAIGGADWLRSAIERDYDAMQKKASKT